jgi:hypothetical protein
MTKSYVLFHHDSENRCGLNIFNSPVFRTSVVKIKGHKLIPFGYSSMHGIKLIGMDCLLNSSSNAAKYEFP